MADLHILIKKSSATNYLRSLSTHDVDCEYLVIPDGDRSDALAELDRIGRDESIFSDIEITEDGEQVNGILLPKSAGK